MSPHRDVSPDDSTGGETTPSSLFDSPEANGHSADTGRASLLRATDLTIVHDLVCVGFGPASLAVAVAIHDALSAGAQPRSDGSPPRVLFLEKQPRFAWHAGMLLPGAKMQISFLKDLATLRDPTSRFTFLNYLHRAGRLVEFTNLGTFLPSRIEYEDYLRWCASFFDDVVQYNAEVLSVSPDDPRVPGSGVETFTVKSRNTRTGAVASYRARNVLLAIGGRPQIPKGLPMNHPRVLHSSQYAHLVPQILDNPHAPYRVAVIGAGQSAAEIFSNIQTLYPNARTWLIMRSEFLRPSDDSPFVNSIFNPSFVDTVHARAPHDREQLLMDARNTNYGVVRLDLIEQLYERMYDQRRELGVDESKWPHRIMGGRVVRGIKPDGTGISGTMKLCVSRLAGCGSLKGLVTNSGDAEELLDVDLVVAATGYQRNAHIDMLKGARHLLPEDGHHSTAPTDGWQVLTVDQSDDASEPRRLSVGRDYRVQFRKGTVSDGSGVWLQGCCEETHGISDTLLSVLATRSGEIVESMFKGEGRCLLQGAK